MTTPRGRLRSITFALLVALVATGMATAPNDSPTDQTMWTKDRVDGKVQPPPSPNPYLANLPTDQADFRSWDAFAAHAAEERRASSPGRGRSPEVSERPGNNDNPNGAQPVFLDTRKARDGAASVDITGNGPDAVEGSSTDIGFAAEPNGAIPEATALPVLATGDDVSGTGVIGDEVDDPFDFDFFALPDLSAGDTIVIDIDTADPFGDLDPFVGFWGSDGPFPLIASNDDDGASFDSLLQVTVPADGTYYVSVGGFAAFVPADPFDPNSPSDTGLTGSQGDYSFSISSIVLDRDHFKFRLRAGDVFGATVFDGGTRLELYGPGGDLLIGSSQDLTFAHPPTSPLPGGGNASASYVIDRAGMYTLAIDSTEDYLAELRAFRPFGDVPGRGSQVLFLDFDGGTVDLTAFGAPPGFEADLSPLVDFLPGWGLDPSDEDAVIDAIVASVVENLEHDMVDFGGNDQFGIEILNSRDHPEPSGPLVSRIVVGGTIAELGIPTVGIAQSIDVGNFETEEVAVVLLDLLSAPDGSPDFIPGLSLNSYPLAGDASLIDLIGVAVGNVTAHEAGHFFANWHTDQFNSSANIMDQGGNFAGTFGIGGDGVFGSADDEDVDFGPDVYVPSEGFSGTENTLTSVSFGLWSISP